MTFPTVMRCSYGHVCSFTPVLNAKKCKTCSLYRLDKEKEVNQELRSQVNDIMKLVMLNPELYKFLDEKTLYQARELLNEEIRNRAKMETREWLGSFVSVK